MLDFDYDEDDEDDGDETPTEAEPPLSSTLSKIEMEQRRAIDKANSALNQSSHNKSNPTDQLNAQQTSQDPVLERWNRIIRQQAEPSEGFNTSGPSSNNSSRVQRRSRSRSPVSTRPQTSYTQQSTSINRMLPYNSRETMNQSKDNSEKSVELKKQSASEAERERKCLPKIRDKHLTVCSSTLWLGHVPKNVSEADLSDAFGEFGTINSIDLIPPRGCAYVCMDRRQDAKRALNESRDLRLNGSHIKMAWAPGKGFKEYKKLKDFWEADVGASFIPYSKVDDSIDFDILEEGGVIDEDSMSMEMRQRRERKANGHNEKSVPDSQLPKSQASTGLAPGLSLPLPVLPMLNQPPPTSMPFAIPPPNLSIPPPVALGQGLIPFPPPGVVTTAPSSSSSSGKMQAPNLPPAMLSQAQGEISSQDSEKSDQGSPLSLDQKLSMTERQISMVEQQLSMIQQAQGLGRSAPNMSLMQGIPQQAMFYPPNQPNPMMFDLPPQQMHLGIPPMLDPQQMVMFMNNPLMNNPLGGQPMIPMSQANMMDTHNLGDMAHRHGGF